MKNVLPSLRCEYDPHRGPMPRMNTKISQIHQETSDWWRSLKKWSDQERSHGLVIGKNPVKALTEKDLWPLGDCENDRLWGVLEKAHIYEVLAAEVNATRKTIFFVSRSTGLFRSALCEMKGGRISWQSMRTRFNEEADLGILGLWKVDALTSLARAFFCWGEGGDRTLSINEMAACYTLTETRAKFLWMRSVTNPPRSV